jgi:hypothetical protein
MIAEGQAVLQGAQYSFSLGSKAVPKFSAIPQVFASRTCVSNSGSSADHSELSSWKLPLGRRVWAVWTYAFQNGTKLINLYVANSN